MQKKYILPVVGQLYQNRNGREYCCLSNATYPNEDAARKALALGEHQASMVRMSDGWCIVVHGIQQYEDGTVEWNYSTGGAFRKEELDRCRNMLRGKDPAWKKYFDYLDCLRMMGTINMFGAVPYLQEEFPELSFDKARAREVLTAWMDSYSTHSEGCSHNDG